MHVNKDTPSALVRIGFDGRVRKSFRGPNARARFENEVRILRHLAERGCGFVPRLLEVDAEGLRIETTHCGQRAEHVSEERLRELFAELEQFGVRHEDRARRNVTYRTSDGRFCVIDFEHGVLLPAAEGDRVAPGRVEWSIATDRGRFRPNNEDAVVALGFDGHAVRYLPAASAEGIGREDFVFAVADGMGGARAGEFASRIALQRMTEMLPRGFRLSAGGLQNGFEDLLNELCQQIHEELLRLGRAYEECAGMGSTLSLIWIAPEWAYYAHVGDSRIYYQPRSPGGAAECRQLTEDHTHVGWLRRKGAINEREAREHPARNALQQVLGASQQTLEPQIGAVRWQPGDRFLLCTDGLNEGLWDRRIGEILRGDAPARELAGPTVAESVEASGRDNATAIAIELER
jgi:serine/threonine protein phosphatase PrpC